jgi:hypothetical protein
VACFLYFQGHEPAVSRNGIRLLRRERGHAQELATQNSHQSCMCRISGLHKNFFQLLSVNSVAEKLFVNIVPFCGVTHQAEVPDDDSELHRAPTQILDQLFALIHHRKVE